MAFGRLGAMGRGLGNFGGGVAGPKPSLISADIRFGIPGTTSNAWFGQQVTTSRMVYSRVGTRSVRAVKRIRKLYTTVGVSTSATLPAAIESARHEQGVGCGQTIRCHTITGPSGTALNQSAATVRVDTFSDLVNDRTFSTGGRTFTMASMLDNTQTPPVYQNRTYAQFVAAGGVVSSSTVNAGSLANSQVFVPRGWSVWTDEGPDVGALEPYFTGLEQETPIATVTGITVPVDGTIVVACSNTDKIMAGDVGTIVNATGNTTVNGTWQIASVVANTSITMTGTTSTSGAVTGTPLIRFAYPTHCFNSQVTFNPLGDYQRAGTTRLDVMGNGDWTSVGASTLVDGSFGPGFAMIIGTDPTGSENVHLTGDSIAFGKGDNVSNDPAADQAGDAAGNMGFYQRALYTHRIPSIRSAVPSEATVSEATKFDNQFRLYMANFADVNLTNHGHNTVFSHATYTPFKASLVAHWNGLRAAGRGRKAVVTNTLNALAAQLLSDKWTTARNSTYQNQAGSAPFVYPGGYVYNNFHAELTGGTLVTRTTGGVDGYIDIAQFDSNIFGVAAIDGYKAVDGVTNYGATIDGTHNSTTGNINIAAQITRPVLIAAKVILS